MTLEYRVCYTSVFEARIRIQVLKPKKLNIFLQSFLAGQHLYKAWAPIFMEISIGMRQEKQLTLAHVCSLRSILAYTQFLCLAKTGFNNNKSTTEPVNIAPSMDDGYCSSVITAIRKPALAGYQSARALVRWWQQACRTKSGFACKNLRGYQFRNTAQMSIHRQSHNWLINNGNCKL
jgi:hypothetical protein